MAKKTTKTNKQSDIPTGHQEFNVPEIQSQFIEIKKKKSKEFNTSHPMKLGYDFVKFSIGFSKRERKSPTTLLETDNKTKLFGESEYLNNPDIDFLFQVIAYSDQIDLTKNDAEKTKDSYNIITDIGSCRKKAEQYNREGFEEIKKLFEISDDPVIVNKKILERLQNYFPGALSDN